MGGRSVGCACLPGWGILLAWLKSLRKAKKNPGSIGNFGAGAAIFSNFERGAPRGTSQNFNLDAIKHTLFYREAPWQKSPPE